MRKGENSRKIGPHSRALEGGGRLWENRIMIMIMMIVMMAIMITIIIQ